MNSSRLKITEIFFSLQGETKTSGLPTVFIRLTGCPLRCNYCDTEYAFTGGQWMTLHEIHEKVKKYGAHYVTVTGGEPLAQKTCIDLLSQLCDQDYEVSLETSGALDVTDVDHRVAKIIDIKTPGSGELDKNRLENLSCLSASDSLKFVICNERDYLWSVTFISEHQLPEQCEVLFSPSHDQLDAVLLAEWILRDRLSVRMQIQLHKYIWGNKPGH